MVFTSSVMKMYKFLLSYNSGLSKVDEDHLSWLIQVVGQGLTTCYLSYEIIKAVARNVRYPAV